MSECMQPRLRLTCLLAPIADPQSRAFMRMRALLCHRCYRRRASRPAGGESKQAETEEMLPLIRLKVDHSDFDTLLLQNQRFGSQFVGRVARRESNAAWRACCIPYPRSRTGLAHHC